VVLGDASCGGFRATTVVRRIPRAIL